MYTSKRNQTAEKKQHSRPFTPGEEPNQLDGDGDVGGEVFDLVVSSPSSPAERREKEAATAGPQGRGEKVAWWQPKFGNPLSKKGGEPNCGREGRSCKIVAAQFGNGLL